MTARLVVWDRMNLLALIEKAMKDEGPFCDLNHLDVSRISDFKALFYRSAFLGNISDWDMSGATTLDGMFEQSKFNGDISKWNVSNVTSMLRVFNRSQFDGDISKWDTSKTTNMEGLFWGGKFNGDLSQWNVSNVQNMSSMFDSAPFKGDLSKWDTRRVTTMAAMFSSSPFDSDISNWNVSSVTNFTQMFAGAIFQGDLSKWDTSGATNMQAMFSASAFRSHLSCIANWNVSKVLSFNCMFRGSDGPLDLSAWQWHVDADTTEMLDDSDLAVSEKPSMYHWAVALENPDLLSVSDRAFFEEHKGMVLTLGQTPYENALLLQQAWLQQHGPQHATEAFALPELGLGDGVGV